MAVIDVNVEPLVTPVLITVGGASVLLGVSQWNSPIGKPLTFLGISAIAYGGLRALFAGGVGDGGLESEIQNLEIRYKGVLPW
jgi:hypothetical protein